MTSNWGPLAPLAGEWFGDDGADWAYSHAIGDLVLTPYRERSTFSPFGPVFNGRQSLYGLDHRSEMWRGEESVPFHSEVGYWLWDQHSGEILKGFVVPRGITVLAGGTAAADAVELNLSADNDHSSYSIAQNKYLASRASALSYGLSVNIHPDGSWTYDETTVLDVGELPGPFEHRDRNTMHRV